MNINRLSIFLLCLVTLPFLGIACSSSDDSDNSDGSDSKVSNIEAVDLGLSVKWADRNVGALQPWGYGSYFAWGELSPKQDYSLEAYKFTNGSDGFTKYSSEDGKTSLEQEDDVATVLCGKKWRMPTVAEVQELLDRCEWVYTVYNDIEGIRAIGPSGNSIFLPFAGSFGEASYNDNNHYLWRYRGTYWCSSRFSDNDTDAYFLSVGYTDSGLHWYRINNDSHDLHNERRYLGLTVRAVCQ